VNEALAAGFTGLRVAAEVTSIVRDPGTWEAHTRWEVAADRYIASHPVCALCCYDRTETPRGLLDDMRCVHPVARADGTRVPFRLFAEPGGIAVSGEIDYFTFESFDRLLALAGAHDGDVELDLSELRFADHHAVLALAAYTRRLRDSGRRVSVTGTPRSVERTCRLVEVEL
jgi:anti-anti-sigma regulatory factor